MELIVLVQPDSSQAYALRHALRARTNAEVVTVASTDAALEVIDRRIPDLLLLHAFLSPEDEHHLVSHLRGLPDAAHLQTLSIPLLRLQPDGEGRKRGLLGALRPRRNLFDQIACDPRTFADEVLEYLARARAIKTDREQLAYEPVESIRDDRLEEEPLVVAIQADTVEPETTASSDRRGTRRWLPSEVPWVRAVRLGGDQADLINVSSGGVLIRTAFRPGLEALKPYGLDPGSLLELIFRLTSGRDVLAPSHVVRCQVASVGSGALRYDIAFRFDEAVGLDLPDQELVLAEVLRQPLTIRTDRLARLLSGRALPSTAHRALSELTVVDKALGEIRMTLRQARRSPGAGDELRDLTGRLGPRIRELRALRNEIIQRVSQKVTLVSAA